MSTFDPNAVDTAQTETTVKPIGGMPASYGGFPFPGGSTPGFGIQSHVPNVGNVSIPGSFSGGGPTYYQGAEWHAMTLLAQQGVLADWQLAFRQAGLIPKKTGIAFGTPDPATATAIRTLMGRANTAGRGVTWQQMLTLAAGGSGGAAGGSGGAAALLPAPQDVKELGMQAARELIGRNLTAPETQAFIDAFYQTYRPYTTGNPTGYQAPDTSSFAAGYLKANMPTETQAQDVTRVYSVFENMLKGGIR